MQRPTCTAHRQECEQQRRGRECAHRAENGGDDVVGCTSNRAALWQARAPPAPTGVTHTCHVAIWVLTVPMGTVLLGARKGTRKTGRNLYDTACKPQSTAQRAAHVARCAACTRQRAACSMQHRPEA